MVEPGLINLSEDIQKVFFLVALPFGSKIKIFFLSAKSVNPAASFIYWLIFLALLQSMDPGVITSPTIVIENGHYPAGAGEPATTVVAPAIANAIDNAVGARVRSLPITPEKIKSAMREA